MKDIWKLEEGIIMLIKNQQQDYFTNLKTSSRITTEDAVS
jgi:hypothetical protein